MPKNISGLRFNTNNHSIIYTISKSHKCFNQLLKRSSFLENKPCYFAIQNTALSNNFVASYLDI